MTDGTWGKVRLLMLKLFLAVVLRRGKKGAALFLLSHVGWKVHWMGLPMAKLDLPDVEERAIGSTLMIILLQNLRLNKN